MRDLFWCEGGIDFNWKIVVFRKNIYDWLYIFDIILKLENRNFLWVFNFL